MQDPVDHILQQWKNTKPNLDCSAMAIVGRLRRVDKSWEKQLNTVFKHHKISSIEFDILATLRRNQVPLTPTQLYKTLMLSSGAMSTRTEALVQRGFIERVSSDKDRRSCKVTLTELGITIIDATLEKHVQNMDNMLEVLTDDEKIQFAALLKKVALADQAL